jgi:hypothetical protein
MPEPASHAALDAKHTPVSVTKAIPAAEEHCALCDWKANTPYTPPTDAWPGVALLVSCDRILAPSRAPPAITLERFQSRAPPRRLSIAFNA